MPLSGASVTSVSKHMTRFASGFMELVAGSMDGKRTPLGLGFMGLESVTFVCTHTLEHMLIANVGRILSLMGFTEELYVDMCKQQRGFLI